MPLPNIIEFIGTNITQRKFQEAQEKLSNKAQVTVEMVVQGLLNEAKDLSEGSTQSARVSAWAHLGKHLFLNHLCDGEHC